jgi:type III pantothenate kinase
MQSGLLYGYVGLVDGLARRIRAELDPRALLVATGGLSTLLGEHSEVITEVDPHLTLRGLALLHERNTA